MAPSSRIKAAKNFDWIIFIVYLSLVGIGLMMIYTTTYHDSEGLNVWSFGSPFGNQLLFAGISVVILFMIYFIDWQFWNSMAIPIYFSGILLLVLVLIFGSEVKGAKSWIIMGPFSIQPSEFAKVGTLLLASSMLTSVRMKLDNLKNQGAMMSIVILPAILIILQPDPGSAITYFSIVILLYRKGMPAIYYVAMISLFLTLICSFIYGYWYVAIGVFLIALSIVLDFNRDKLRSIMIMLTLILSAIVASTYDFEAYILSIIVLTFLYFLFVHNRQRTISQKFGFLLGLTILCFVSVSFSLGFNLLKPHQQDRINVWLQPEKCDPRGSLYNLIQSKLAIGSGGFSGKGFLNGDFTKLNYVPEQTTDFIFSSIGEEQGFIGSVGVIVLFTILMLRIINNGEQSRHQFVLNYSYALVGLLFVHFFINIGMTMGISPVIGIPLPFISKGGSSLIAFSIMIGIMLKMSEDN